MTNAALREHVTSIGFSIALSKNQLETLVCLHHCGDSRESFRYKITHHYCATAGALIRRGLMRDYGPGVAYVPCELCDEEYCFKHKLTRAGVLVAQLLSEAGLYQEVLQRYGVAQVEEVGVA